MAARSNISQGSWRGRLPAHIAACAVASIAFGAVAGGASAQNLPPSYGTRTLSTGDGGEFTIELQAGGFIDATQVLGPACVGMVAEAPDFRLQLQGDGSVQLDTSVASTADTTLVISTPDGQWLCNDDSDGFDPAIEVPRARAGLYDIWVGTFSVGGLPQASLTVAVEARDDDRVQAGSESESAVDVETSDRAGARTGDESGWWYSMDGERIGPVTVTDIDDAIAEGDITRETLVWRDGMDSWSAASSVEAVDDLFPVEPPPLPIADPGDEQEEADPAMPPPLPPALPDSNNTETGADLDDQAPKEEMADDTEGDAVPEEGTEGNGADEPVEAETQPAKPATAD